MFETYCIKSGNWSALVAPKLGANVTELKYNGKDVFVPLKSEAQLEVNQYTQGAPILLPANRTADGKFSFEGVGYQLPITELSTGANLHGTVHKQPFSALEYSEDKIVLAFENKGEAYPFHFVMKVTYTFENGAFVQKYDIKNTSNGKMPFTFALHTSFVEPDVFTVPIDKCQRKNSIHLPIGGYYPLDEQEALYVTGSKSKGLNVSGYYRATGHTATVGDFDYTVSDNFDHWILFNGAGKRGLLCVEPQCGAVNGLNSKDGCTVLDIGEEISFKTSISKR